MKLIAFLLFLLFCNTMIFAQTPFQGIVQLRLKDESEKKSGRVEIYYGQNKILGMIRTKDSSENGKDDILLDFSKGIQYRINRQTKTYRVDSITADKDPLMSDNMVLDSSKRRTIIGYSSAAYSLKDSTESSFFGNMEMTSWYADSLFFPLEKAYAGSSETKIFTNGKTIGMGMEMSLSLGKDMKKAFELLPLSITPQLMPDSLFEIPVGFAEEVPMADSFAYPISPVEDAPAISKPATKSAKPRQTTKTKTKSAATKPKE